MVKIYGKKYEKRVELQSPAQKAWTHMCVCVYASVCVWVARGVIRCSFVFGQTCEYFCNFWSKVAQEMGLAYGCHRGQKDTWTLGQWNRSAGP